MRRLDESLIILIIMKYVIYYDIDNPRILNELSQKNIDMKDIILIKTSQECDRIYYFGYMYIETTENNGSLSCFNMIKKYANHFLISSSYYIFLNTNCTLLQNFPQNILDIISQCPDNDLFINQRPSMHILIAHKNVLVSSNNFISLSIEEQKLIDVGLVVRNMENICNFAFNIKYLDALIEEEDSTYYPNIEIKNLKINKYEIKDNSFYKIGKKYKIKKGKRRKYWKSSF